MDYSIRYQQLSGLYVPGKDVCLPDTNINVVHYKFISNTLCCKDATHKDDVFSDGVDENEHFFYPVFVPANQQKADKAILLLHGLNERNWNKYLSWAEYLCIGTGRPVILFPIAFHINRTPDFWSNPRKLFSIYEKRKNQFGDIDHSMSFANVAISERISEEPYRFYSSGRQSLNDIVKLMKEIKGGEHALFEKDTRLDVFSYSIGSFLSQVAFMTNPDNLLADSKLFMFCGGSIFSSMFGQSRSIMDSVAFDKMMRYYQEEFTDSDVNDEDRDNALIAFKSMISPERNEQRRIAFFRKIRNRFKGVSLEKDTVIPYLGVEKALGTENTKSNIELLDFPFDYSHEIPFPVGAKIDASRVDSSFKYVFDKAVAFFA